jgi:hypothetical protein
MGLAKLRIQESGYLLWGSCAVRMVELEMQYQRPVDSFLDKVSASSETMRKLRASARSSLLSTYMRFFGDHEKAPGVSPEQLAFYLHALLRRP